MAWWSNARRRGKSQEVTLPVSPQPVKPVWQTDAFDYENTPHIWVWRDEQVAFRTLRVFLAGNRPLTRLDDGFDEPRCMSYDEFREFRLALIQVTRPTARLDVLNSIGTWEAAIHRDYLALHQVILEGQEKQPEELNVLGDKALRKVLGILQRVQGWGELPPVEFVYSHPNFGGNRWRPSS